jgi:hypothetical protein
MTWLGLTGRGVNRKFEGSASKMVTSNARRGFAFANCRSSYNAAMPPGPAPTIATAMRPSGTLPRAVLTVRG